jgi:hypothetical protein
MSGLRGTELRVVVEVLERELRRAIDHQERLVEKRQLGTNRGLLATLRVEALRSAVEKMAGEQQALSL